MGLRDERALPLKRPGLREKAEEKAAVAPVGRVDAAVLAKEGFRISDAIGLAFVMSAETARLLDKRNIRRPAENVITREPSRHIVLVRHRLGEGDGVLARFDRAHRDMRASNKGGVAEQADAPFRHRRRFKIADRLE